MFTGTQEEADRYWKAIVCADARKRLRLVNSVVIGDAARRILSQSAQFLCFAVRLAQIGTAFVIRDRARAAAPLPNAATCPDCARRRAPE